MAGMHNMLLGLQAGTGGGGVVISTVDMVDPFGDGSGIALYRFNGDATDASGNYNGTATGVTYDAGVFGQAVKSNAITASVSFGIHDFSVPKTLSFWAKTNFNIHNGQNTAALPTISCTDAALVMYKYNSVQSGATTIVLSNTFSIDMSNFKHIVLIINYPTVTMYLDGVLFFSKTMSSNVGISNYDFGLWDVGAHSAAALNGLVDQFRIFNRALTEAEVTVLHIETIAA